MNPPSNYQPANQRLKLEEQLAKIRPQLKVNPGDYPLGSMAPSIRFTTHEEGYTLEENTILKYFFTNIHRNVYGARSGRMPDELWAFLIGKYSRSSLSLRDKLLAVFEEMHPEKKTEENHLALQRLVQQIRQSQAIEMQTFLKRAQAFLGKWGVGGYGHASLRDSDILRLAVEGVSQLATKYLEAAPLGGYQEQSTRYLNFRQRKPILTPALRDSVHSQEIKDFFSRVMQRYERAFDEVKRYMIQKVVDRKNFSTEEEYRQKVRGRTLDVVRYFLPLATQTSLGMTLPTREAERHLSWLLSQPLAEIQLLGYSLLEEAWQLSPVLLEHVGINDYEIKRNQKMQQLAEEKGFLPPAEFRIGKETPSLIVSSNNRLEQLLAAAFVYEYSNMPFSAILERIQANDSAENEAIFQAYLLERGPFDEVAKAGGINLLNLDSTLDIGAYRDLARHRRCLQLRQKFTPEHGYELPEFLAEAKELINTKEEYLRSIHESYHLWQKVQPEIGEEAQYLTLLGHKINFLISLDPREISYIIELRSRPGGHYSYQTFVREVHHLLEQQLPAFAQYVKVHS